MRPKERQCPNRDRNQTHQQDADIKRSERMAGDELHAPQAANSKHLFLEAVLFSRQAQGAAVLRKGSSPTAILSHSIALLAWSASIDVFHHWIVRDRL
jgi:hypothetical protein